MRVQRLGGILAGLLLWGAAAAAQDCASTSFTRAYRAGEAAAVRKDFGEALAAFRPLAEQGLGPAQRWLGRLLADGSGTAADPVDAVRWTARAAAIDAPGAKEQLEALERRLSPDQRAQATAPSTWRPELGPCLAVDPTIKHGEAASHYDFPAIINHVLNGLGDTAPTRRQLEWLARTLEIIRAKEPRFLIYLKSLDGIGFASGGPLAVILRRAGYQPVIVINDQFIDTVSTDKANELARVAAEAIHDLLVPPSTAMAVETYRGRTIRTMKTDEGRRFLTLIRQAIDLAETLPPELAALARGTVELRYEPTEDYDKRGGAIFTGEWRHDASGKGYMAYPRGIELRKPREITLNLVAGGVYARRDAAHAHTNIRADPAGYRQDECERVRAIVHAMEALHFPYDEITRGYTGMSRQGCAR